jgi:hypothetical protein
MAASAETLQPQPPRPRGRSATAWGAATAPTTTENSRVVTRLFAWLPRLACKYWLQIVAGY